MRVSAGDVFLCTGFDSFVKKPAVLIIVENLPVPLDRRVWQESCALRDAGYEVVVICPKMRGYTAPEEKLEGIQIYRHWISEEAGGFIGFFGEYASALFGELRLAVKAWFRHRFKIIHLCNPPDLLFLVALPFKLVGVKIIYDVHDVWPEMFEAKFGKRGLFYAITRLAERLTYATAKVVLATNESVRKIAIARGGKKPENVFVVRTAPKIGAVEGVPDLSLKKGMTFLVGYVGVMGDADGLSYLLDAAAFVIHKKGRKDVQFLLMGTGPEFPRLIEQRKRLALEEFVDMPGRVSNEYLFAALRTIDVGVSCDPINSYNDHCTMNKVLEYMAFGRAQVLFDLKEGRESAAEAAVYVPNTSGDDLGQAIIATLDDEIARNRMGQIGAERIRSVLNWEKSVQHLLKAYERALS
jgi:glycosyltransferase involved in cell wall biosynthesis